jgi:hypothetical protein
LTFLRLNFFHHNIFLLGGAVFGPQNLNTAQAVLVSCRTFLGFQFKNALVTLIFLHLFLIFFKGCHYQDRAGHGQGQLGQLWPEVLLMSGGCH